MHGQSLTDTYQLVISTPGFDPVAAAVAVPTISPAGDDDPFSKDVLINPVPSPRRSCAAPWAGRSSGWGCAGGAVPSAGPGSPSARSQAPLP
jgi:hypothetical protein